MYPYICKQDLENEEIEKKDVFDRDDDFREDIIDAIEDAIEDQYEKSRYYERLYNKITNEKDRGILRRISLDELKFKKIFDKIYKLLTGKNYVIKNDVDLDDLYDDDDDTILEELYDSIEDQLESVDFYRMLMSMFKDLPIRDLIYEVIVGKQRNAQNLSNLYNKYKK